MILTAEQGKDIVCFARNVVEGYFRGEKAKKARSLSGIASKRQGVFVTLHEGGGLRGCVGFAEPVYPLICAVEEAALSAAFRDPRFPPVHSTELTRIMFEVSVLTKPRIISVSDPGQYIDHILVGRDGLIAQRGNARGLLLPQVPVERGWTAVEFLENTCMKAGLMMEEYKKKGFDLFSFQAQIFAEESPSGNVMQCHIV